MQDDAASTASKPKNVIEVEQGADGRWLRTDVGGERLVVADGVVAAVRRHADEVHRDRPGHEAFGALVVADDGRVVRYTRLSNPSRKPGHVSIRAPWQLERRRDGHRLIGCHSHPPGTRTTPSPRDIETAHRFGWSTFAIWSRSDGLRFWRPDDGDGGVAEVEFALGSAGLRTLRASRLQQLP
jgi:proteasome lid subunit RPN8/RPN11